MNPHRLYAQELRRRLPARYFKPVPHRLLWILPYAAVVVGGITLIGSGDLPVLAKIGVSLLIGLAFCGLQLLGHEIVHGAMTHRPWVREALGGLCFLPGGVSPMLWRLWHNVQHHTHTQIHGRDPDTRNTLAQYHQRWSLRLLHRLIPARSIGFFAMLPLWFTFHTNSVLLKLLLRLPWRDRLTLVAETLVPIGLWVGLGAALGWHRFVYFYILPFLLSSFIIMAHIATNHFLNPLLEDDDPLAGSLSLIEPKALDVLLSNFSHHAEHHVFPAMSAKYLPEVRLLLRELWPDRYHEMTLGKAMLALWKTPRLYLDNNLLVDPHTGETYGVLGHGLDPDYLEPAGIISGRAGEPPGA